MIIAPHPISRIYGTVDCVVYYTCTAWGLTRSVFFCPRPCTQTHTCTPAHHASFLCYLFIVRRDILRTVRAETGLLLDFSEGQRSEFAGSINCVLNALALVDGMGYCQVRFLLQYSAVRHIAVAVILFAWESLGSDAMTVVVKLIFFFVLC